MIKKILKLFCFLSIVGCVMDRLNKNIVIKNETNKRITIFMIPKNYLINDTIIYYTSGYEILPNSTKDLYTMTSKKKDMEFYIYSSDTIYSFIKIKKIDGIAEHGLLKKFFKSKEDLEKNDTLIIK